METTLIKELEHWYHDGSDAWFQRILKRCQGIPVEADQVKDLRSENTELRKALRAIIAECPVPRTGYGVAIVDIAKQALERR